MTQDQLAELIVGPEAAKKLNAAQRVLARVSEMRKRELNVEWQRKEIVIMRNEIQAECPHPASTYIIDPTGDYDWCYKCELCGLTSRTNFDGAAK